MHGVYTVSISGLCESCTCLWLSAKAWSKCMADGGRPPPRLGETRVSRECWDTLDARPLLVYIS